MVFSEFKEKQLKKMPQVETKIRKSKDGKFIINQTIITSIKPVAYFETVLKSEDGVEVDTNLNSFEESEQLELVE